MEGETRRPARNHRSGRPRCTGLRRGFADAETPNVPGDFNTGTRVLRLIRNRWEQAPSWWAEIAAHELGHAHGFHHAGTTDASRTVMTANYATGWTGMTPRVLDKCAAVKAYPVPLQ